MAYSTRGSRGSRDTRGRSRSSAGGRGGGGGGGGGGSNPVPMVIAGVVLVGVVALFFVLNKKDAPAKPNVAPPAIDTSTKPKTGPEPVKPKVRAPLPAMPADLIQRGKGMMPKMKEAGEKGMALYNDALKAKEGGDDAGWQEKMDLGREILTEAMEEWNELEEDVQKFVNGKMPLEGWANADEVVGAMLDANLKAEQGVMQKSIDTPLQKMRKTGRGGG